MLKIFIYKRLTGVSDCQLLRLILSNNEYEGGLFQTTKVAPFKEMVEIVNEVNKANVIFLPHDYLSIKNQKEYLEELSTFAEVSKKQILAFAYGDYNMPIILKGFIILRPTAYKNLLQPNEIIVPAFIDDITGLSNNIRQRAGTPIPTIGFAGMVGMPSFFDELKFNLKVLYKKIFNANSVYKLPGIYFRRIAVKILNKSSLCKTNFIIRNSYSASAHTISGSPEKVREEYIDNLLNSDLGLVVRGNGNYSLRFFELLALGRVPVFVDTNTPLPLEEIINYDEFMLRVDYADLEEMPKLVQSFWNSLSPEKFEKMQLKAKQTYQEYLRVDKFYANLFRDLAEKTRPII